MTSASYTDIPFNTYYFEWKTKIVQEFWEETTPKICDNICQPWQVGSHSKKIKFMKEEKFVCLQNKCNISFEIGIIYALEKVNREK